MLGLYLRLLAFLVLAAVLVAPGQAGEWETSGFVGIEGRHFFHAPRWPGQRGGTEGSVLLQPEARWYADDGRYRAALVGFARLDGWDDQRTHADLRELYWAYEADDWDLLLGVNRVFWGVTESRHLVDIINQVDLVEDIDQEDKLGQPMVNLNLQRDWGRLGLFVMPYFRERTFPGSSGRLRSPVPIDTDRPLYESGAGGSHVDVALRYSHFIGDLDLGLHLFDGTDREPRFVLDPSTRTLRPVYEQMSQAGLDLQYTREAWLWKLEALVRERNDDVFGAVVGGFEYTFYQVAGRPDDVGVLLEGLYDGRGRDALATLYDNDIFAGLRWARNDAQDSTLLAGLLVDVDSGETLFSVEAERRVGESLVAELRLRLFADAVSESPMNPISQDDYLQLRFSWYW
ncbi:MAG: hypothetical protein GWP66_06215 [Gammaproteobacteria bacterium]|jgi:hypothetical protein|nr:hypothetical protein [Gammaproteobacteria bacterium]